MTDKVQKIREVIEKRYEYWREKEFKSHSIESEIRMSECQHLLLIVNSLQKEPVSEEWIEELRTKLDSMSKEEFKKVFDKYAVDFNEELVSEELIDVAKQYVKEHVIGIDKVTFSIATDMFVSGAKWKIAKLMANATEVTVHIEAGNYPYIPQIELYDYDKDVPLAKEGDKYKVVLIKED